MAHRYCGGRGRLARVQGAPGEAGTAWGREGPNESADDLVVRWLSSAERASVRAIWQGLEKRVATVPLACTWDWTDAWLSQYGDLVPHRFAIGEAGDRPCGVALITNGVGRRRGPFLVRSLHLGTAGEPQGDSVFVEYNGVLVDPEHRVGFATALVRELHSNRGWHELVLDGFAPEDAEPFLAADPMFEANRMPSPTMDLRTAGSGDGDVLAVLKSGTRRKVRRSLEALGAVAMEWAETADDAFDILSELIELHQRRWTGVGEPGAFAKPRFVAFHRELVSRLLPTRRVILFRARTASETVGCLYHFVDRGRVLFYQSGLASYSDRRISPGFVTFALCMQECYERGLSEYDFLAGDSRYKRDLATGSGELIWATSRRPALRWHVLDRLATARRRLRADA